MLKTGVQLLALAGFWLSGPTSFASAKSIGAFAAEQAKISIEGVLANIGPDGAKAQGASPGVVVASPSRADPDCKSRSQTHPPGILAPSNNFIPKIGTPGRETLL